MKYLALLLLLTPATHQPPFQKIQLAGKAQGTTWHIIYYATDTLATRHQVDSIFDAIDSALSLYKPYSVINRFNQSVKGCAIGTHFINVIRKSLSTYADTHGAFDITVQPLVKAWGFGNAPISQLPDSGQIRRLLSCIGSDKLRLKPHFLRKTDPCITIDVNGIAQGYTVDVIARFLQSRQIHDFIVEVGGEIAINGHRQPSGDDMKVGIESPADNGSDDPFMQKIVSFSNGAITTSGSYRKFYESNGMKINHLIDPATGYPVHNEMISVTVFAQDAITADAFDNALMVMGLQKAMDFVDGRKDLAAYFIYNRNGVVTDTASKRFRELFK